MQEIKGRQETYIPVCAIERITAKHLMGRVPIAQVDKPEKVCGVARRIGYTGTHDYDLAIYRLKVKEHEKSDAIMLPTLFVVDGGSFVDYDEWQRKKNVQ